MRVDTGILDGSEALWQQDLLFDLTLKVQHKEFRVHKFMLAAVSGYFRKKLSRSTKSLAVLVNVERMSDLIKYIYTRDNVHLTHKPHEMLEMAVFFQMPTVIEKCKENVGRMVTVENCLGLMAAYKEMELVSLRQGCDTVTDFIKRHAMNVLEHYPIEEFQQDVLEIVIDAVGLKDVDLFNVLKFWFEGDFDKRKHLADRMMNRVKFHHMPAGDVLQISEEMDSIKLQGSWRDRFEKALVYHRLPIHLKMLNDSENTKIESNKSLMVMKVKQDANGLSKVSVLDQIEGQENRWKTCNPLKIPNVSGSMPFVINVNDFLITCSEFGKDQQWQVFDPRTLKWFKMANMSRPRDAFAIVQHHRHLYVLGGSVGFTKSTGNVLTDTIEEYSFDTGIWSSTKKLPVPVKNHSACALNGRIYVSGGQLAMKKGTVMSDKLYCLNLSSLWWGGVNPIHLNSRQPSTGTWETKAAMLRPMAHHTMCVMTVEGKETIVVINHSMEIHFYDLLSDQWSTCDFSVNKHNFDDFREEGDTTTVDVKDLKWGPESRMFVDGNTVYMVNLVGQELKYYEGLDDFDYWGGDNICVKWVIGEKKREINDYTLDGFPSSHWPVPRQPSGKRYPPPNILHALLAFPPSVFKFENRRQTISLKSS